MPHAGQSQVHEAARYRIPIKGGTGVVSGEGEAGTDGEFLSAHVAAQVVAGSASQARGCQQRCCEQAGDERKKR